MVGQLHFWHWKAPMLHCEAAAQNREMLCQSWWSVWDALKRNHLRGGWGSIHLRWLDWTESLQHKVSACRSVILEEVSTFAFILKRPCYFFGWLVCLHFTINCKSFSFLILDCLHLLLLVLLLFLLLFLPLFLLLVLFLVLPLCMKTPLIFFPPTVNNRTLQICPPWSEYKYTLVQISNIYTWIRTFVSCFITIRLIPANPFTRDLIYNSASSPSFHLALLK